MYFQSCWRSVTGVLEDKSQICDLPHQWQEFSICNSDFFTTVMDSKHTIPYNRFHLLRLFRNSIWVDDGLWLNKLFQEVFIWGFYYVRIWWSPSFYTGISSVDSISKWGDWDYYSNWNWLFIWVFLLPSFFILDPVVRIKLTVFFLTGKFDKLTS